MVSRLRSIELWRVKQVSTLRRAVAGTAAPKRLRLGRRVFRFQEKNLSNRIPAQNTMIPYPLPVFPWRKYA